MSRAPGDFQLTATAAPMVHPWWVSRSPSGRR